MSRGSSSCNLRISNILTRLRSSYAQGRFLSAFGLSKSDIPTVVTFSPKKLRGAQLNGAFSAEGIHKLLDGLFSGRIHSSPFQVRSCQCCSQGVFLWHMHHTLVAITVSNSADAIGKQMLSIIVMSWFAGVA